MLCFVTNPALRNRENFVCVLQISCCVWILLCCVSIILCCVSINLCCVWLIPCCVWKNICCVPGILLLCFKKCLLCLQIKATVIREYITLTRLNYISFLPRTMADLIKRKILVACKIWSQDFENHPLNRPNPMIITKYYIVDLKEIF